MITKRISLSGLVFLLTVGATVVSWSAPNSLNYGEPFESWAINSNLLDSGWWAGSAEIAHVTNAPVTYEDIWTNTYPYPTTNTLFPVQGVPHANVVSFTNAQARYGFAAYYSFTNTIVDFMMDPVPNPVTPDASMLANAQTVLFVDDNKKLNAWYRPTLESTNWTTFADKTVTNWARVSIMFKYYTAVNGTNFFKVALNGIDQVPTSGGFNNLGDSFAPGLGGIWMMAVSQTNRVNAFALSGNGSLDDLVVTTNAAVHFYGFDVVASAGVEGTIDPVRTNVNAGDNQLFVIARTNLDYRIADVTTNGSSITFGAASFNNESVSTNWTWNNVRGTGVVDATFTLRWFTLVGSNGVNGTVTPASTNAWAGSSQPFAITANANYRILDVTTNGTTIGASAFDNDSQSTNWVWQGVRGTGLVHATFTTRKFLLTSTYGARGTNFVVGAPAPSNSTNAIAGSSITFTIRTNTPECQIESITTNGWSIGALGNGVFSTNWVWSNVQSTGVVDATFTERKFLMVGSAGANGTVNPTSTNINIHSNLTFTIAADSNYRIAGVTSNGVAIGGPYGPSTLTTNIVWNNVQSTGLVSATFTPKTFNLTASAGPQGMVTPTSTNVNAGTSPIFAIATTTTAYRILEVITSNSLAQVTNSSFDNSSRNYNFTWSDIQADGSLRVTFTNQISRGSIYKMF